MNFLGIDPLKYYRRKGRHSEALVVKSAPKELSTGTNQVVVAAVTGKRIRVMAMYGHSNTATRSQVELIDGSGGSSLLHPTEFPGTNDENTFHLPPWDAGYCETSTGTGLYANVTGAAADFTVFYIEYTP